METVIASLDTILCPNCRHAIPISEMLAHQIAERARAQSKVEIEELRAVLAREQWEIKEREKKVEVLVKKRVAARVVKIEADEREKARGSVLPEIKDLKNQLAEVLNQRDAAQKGELEARKRARELDQRAKKFDKYETVVSSLPSAFGGFPTIITHMSVAASVRGTHQMHRDRRTLCAPKAVARTTTVGLRTLLPGLNFCDGVASPDFDPMASRHWEESKPSPLRMRRHLLVSYIVSSPPSRIHEPDGRWRARPRGAAAIVRQ